MYSYVGDMNMTLEVCQDAGSATDAMTTAALTTIRRQKVFSQSLPEVLNARTMQASMMIWAVSMNQFIIYYYFITR